MKQRVQSLLGRYGFALTRTRRGHMAELFRHRHIDHVIDIGANTGQFAGEVRRAGYRGKLTCYEPNPKAAELIPAHLDAEIRNVLVADETSGNRTLRIYDKSDFASIFSLQPDFAARYGVSNQDVQIIQVPSVRLDDEHLAGERIYLKIDTQGSEAIVLKGGRDLLARTAVIQAEIPFLSLYTGAPKAIELLGILADMGFHLTRMYPVTFIGQCIVDADAFFERLPDQYRS